MSTKTYHNVFKKRFQILNQILKRKHIIIGIYWIRNLFLISIYFVMYIVKIGDKQTNTELELKKGLFRHFNRLLTHSA